MTVIFTDKFINFCPKCGKSVRMKYYAQQAGDKTKEIFLAFCEKDSILFISLVEDEPKKKT